MIWSEQKIGIFLRFHVEKLNGRHGDGLFDDIHIPAANSPNRDRRALLKPGHTYQIL
jgi:hypothetical protein